MFVAAPIVLRPGDESRLRAVLRCSTAGAGVAQRARIVLLAAEGVSNAEIGRRVGVSRPTVLTWRGDQLVRWSRRRKSSQALALRSRVVLACAQGLDNKAVAAQVGCAAVTVGKWRARFVADRLDGLVDEAPPGRPPVISVDQVEDVVVATLESMPAGATHWSRAKMAKRSGLSKSTIGRIWRTFELKPHRQDGFKLSNDPLFVDKTFATMWNALVDTGGTGQEILHAYVVKEELRAHARPLGHPPRTPRPVARTRHVLRQCRRIGCPGDPPPRHHRRDLVAGDQSRHPHQAL